MSGDVERGQVIGETRRRPPQPKRQSAHLDNSALEPLGRRTYLTAVQAADYLGHRTVNAFWKWIARRKKAGKTITPVSDGSRTLFLRRDLDRAYTKQTDGTGASHGAQS
jgi:hypothetical protein